jgi:type IV pilus assembly protein PilB
MGIEPFLIASTVRAVVGQRLVRRLCPDCKVSIAPDAAMLAQVAEIFNTGTAAIMKHIHELEEEALTAGIGKTATTNKKSKDSPDALSTTDSKIVRLWQASPDGCAACGHSGYKGRMGIYEVLGNSETVQKLIVTGSTSDAIQQQAIKEGMITMQLDGLVKALRGQTSIEEILRVTSES